MRIVSCKVTDAARSGRAQGGSLLVRYRLLAALTCAGTFLLAPDVSLACGGFPCAPDQFIPRAGEVPVNLDSIAWWPGTDWTGAAPVDGGPGTPVMTEVGDLRFECGPDGGSTRSVSVSVERVRLGLDWRIKPNETLSVGDVCKLSSKTVSCDLRGEAGESILKPPPDYDDGFLSGEATFKVVDSAPLPAALGRIAAKPAAFESIEISDSGGACSVSGAACVIQFEIELADEALPWRDTLVYSTWVDEKEWSIKRSAPVPHETGGLYLGRGRDLIYAMQKNLGQSGLSIGRHSIVIRASVGNTDLHLETDPIRVNLDCGTNSEETDAGKSKPTGRSDTDSSCSVRTRIGHRVPGTLTQLTLAALGLSLAIRKRRRR